MKNTRSHEPKEQYCAQQRSTQTNTQIYTHVFIISTKNKQVKLICMVKQLKIKYKEA